MLHTLLLQAPTHTTTVEVTSLTNVYIALSGTLVAAIIAALASRNAARTAKEAANIASTTAQRVADLSRQTTREVADLSAQVSRESATLAARTAQELKDKDYKNDFYKKIIEIRLNAWSDAESLGNHMTSIICDESDNKKFLAFFSSSERFKKAINELDKTVIKQVFWIGGDYNRQLVLFRLKLYNIYEECRIKGTYDENNLTVLDNKKLISQGKEHHQEFQYMLINMMTSLEKQFINLHDIEEFLKTPRGNMPV